MMEGESDSLLCVVCSAQVTYTDNSPDISSSNYLSFSQFCGELEKCGEQSDGNDKRFNATQFFHSVDTAASVLLICEECKKLVNEVMKLRVNLEKWEMEVLKLQIELLMKLKELEKCNDNYFSEMRRIYDKVVVSVDNDLEEEGICFGATSLSKNDVNLFREKILDVVPNLALFQDDLKRKLGKPLKLPRPASDPEPEEDIETADDFQPMEIDIKTDPFSGQDNSDSDNEDLNAYHDNHEDDHDDFNDNQEEANSSDSSSNSSDSSESEPKIAKKKRKIRKIDPPNLEDCPLPFPLPKQFSKHKKSLIKYISIPPSKSPTLQPPFSPEAVYSFLLKSYPWNYNPTSDILTLGESLPVKILDTNKLTLKCSTCNFSAIYKFNRFSFNHISILARRMFEHLLTTHLNGFKCPITPTKCMRKRSLRDLCRHLAQLHSKDTTVHEDHRNDRIDDDPQILNPKISRIFDDLPPLPFPMPQATQDKQLLIQNILIAPLPSNKSPLQSPITHDTTYAFMLQSYPWKYTPTSDTLTLGDLQIKIVESQGKDTCIGLQCSTCNFSAVHKHIDRKRSVFGIVRKMWEHVVISHLDGFKCPLSPGKCVKKLGDMAALSKHLARVHGGRRRGSLFHCSLCGKGLVSLKACLEHEDIHKDKEERDHVTCEICGVSLLRTSLRQHRTYFCGKRAPRTVCQICGISFSKKGTIRDHMLRKHAGEEVKTFVCEVCGRRYAVEIDLRNHRRNKHKIFTEGMGKECRKGCGLRFTWHLTLCKHEDRCDGVKVERK